MWKGNRNLLDSVSQIWLLIRIWRVYFYNRHSWTLLLGVQLSRFGVIIFSVVLLFFIILFLNKFIYFIYFWLHWVFIAVCGLSPVVARGGYSLLWCTGFSLWWLLLLRSTGSRWAGFSSCGSWALEHRLSSCGARA